MKNFPLVSIWRAQLLRLSMALELFVFFLSKYVSRHIIDQMYKVSVRPHIDYSDVIYHDQSMSPSS